MLVYNIIYDGSYQSIFKVLINTKILRTHTMPTYLLYLSPVVNLLIILIFDEQWTYKLPVLPNTSSACVIY